MTLLKPIGVDTIPVPTLVGDSTSAFMDALHANRENSFKDIMKKTAQVEAASS